MRFLAQETDIGVDIGQNFAPAQKFSSLSSFVNLIAKLLTFGGGLFVVATIIYASYMYISAEGDVKKTDQARAALTWGVIGLVLIAVSYWIVQIIARFLGRQF